MTTWTISRLDARDRALLERWAISPTGRRTVRLGWSVITHLGGVWCSILAAALPTFATVSGELHEASERAIAVLIISHLVVQLLKRTCGRPRPSLGCGRAALIAEPDRFSFPSGHATASMSVALAYAVAFPAFGVPLVLLSLLVGFSRVCLGVHYPGDVVIGQLIAAVTAAGVFAIL